MGDEDVVRPLSEIWTALKGQRAGVTRHPSQPTSWTSPSHGITPEHGCIARGHQGVPFDEDFQVHEEVLGTQNKTFAFSSWHLCKIDSHITEPGEQPPHVGEPNRASKSPPRPQHRRRVSPADRCRPWSINVTKIGRSRRASTRPWPPWARIRPSSKVGELGGRDPRCHCRHGAPVRASPPAACTTWGEPSLRVASSHDDASVAFLSACWWAVRDPAVTTRP
jgi:hypothetical protein